MASPPTIGVGMLGYGFMGQAHSFALRSLATVAPPPLLPRLVAICGRNEAAVQAARERHGWERAVVDWQELIDDDEIQLFDNGGPNHLHLEPVLAAVKAGKHVLCEKPLAANADDAFEMWHAAESAQVVHLCGFNFRFMPAVRLARRMIDEGELGEIVHFRAKFLASSALDDEQQRTWRFQRATAGSGALADLGSHIVDLARYLAGEPWSVAAIMKTFVDRRDGGVVDVDDAFCAVMYFDNGALGSIEATRAAGRRSNTCTFEVDGTRGSLSFNVERLNTLEVIKVRKRPTLVDVTDPDDPFMKHWWPSPGHAIGWGDSFTHELHHLLTAIAGDTTVEPIGASFRDGYRCAQICDAINVAAMMHEEVTVAYREVPTDPSPS